jgi:NADPH-dependent glutamate synthase beta subunit-like oxidoreductase
LFNHVAQVVGPVADKIPPGGGGVGMHVIPVEAAIPAESKSVSVEHLSHWLNKYDKYAIAVCSCRRQQRIRNEGVGDIEGDLCIGVGDMAEYLVETQKDTHYITYDECLEMLKRSEEKGYVHQITNLDGQDKIVGICNCSPGACNGIRTSQLYNTPNLSASAYRAHVDAAKCVACGKCVEVCPVGAAKLGQKLCKKDGEAITYPKMELPDFTAWGPDKWNYNFREDAQINCYDTGTSPCKTACPAHISVQGYVRMAAEGRYMDALKLIKLDNPLPAVCGAICNRRCEDRCTRGTIDEPVAIDEIKKFIAALELTPEGRYIPNCYNDEGKQWDDYKIAIIGSGPAGLSAAYYLRTMGYPVTIFEKENAPGGMLRFGIPSFRLEKNIIDAEIDVIKTMGAEIRCGVEIGKDITLDELREQGYKAFFVAIGLQGGRKVGLPGEDAIGIETGVDFLRRINLDTEQRISGKTVVIGGGNVAIDVARSAIRAGASEVTMLCLESVEEMPAAADEVAEAIVEGITIQNGWGPKEFVVKDGKVSGVVFKKCLSVFNDSGKFEPQYDENDTITVECDNVLTAIGQKAEWGGLLDGSKIVVRGNGTAEADKITLQTAEPDVFVGGDIYHGARFAIDAIAEGKEAVVSLNRFVHVGQSLTIGRDLREFIEFDRDDVQIESFDNAKRQIPGTKQGKAIETFSDMRLPLTEEQVRIEANRCLNCGATVVDENRCIGCGLCTTRCEFDAISLSRDLPQNSKMYVAEEGKIKGILPYAIKRAVKIKLNIKK